MKKIFTLFTLLTLGLTLQAQEIGYGFKTGLNFNRFVSDDLRPGDEYANNTGFHVGAVFAYKFTDLMGLRAELLYSIKGGRVRYDGAGAFRAESSDSGRIFALTGTRKSTNRVVNSYIDIPLIFYVKPISWLEFSVGAQAGFLGGSTGVGEIRFDGETTVNNQFFDLDEFIISTDYSYRKDEFDDAVNRPQVIEIAGENAALPATIGAYYEQDEDNGRLYNTVDFGLIGGVSFYLNEGLFVGARLNYGLTDITREAADRVLEFNEDTNTVESVARDDFDRNVTVQASVGFIF